MLSTLLEHYYLKHHYMRRDGGDHTEWRVHRKTYAECMYVLYNGGRGLFDFGGQPSLDCMWMWVDWYSAEKAERQEWFRQMSYIAQDFGPSTITYYQPVSLAPLPLSEPCPLANFVQVVGGWLTPDQQGINPMKTMTTSTDLTINTSAQPSDASKARDFLMSEFRDMTRYSWNEPRIATMRKLYNIDAPTIPQTSQEIIDAFKNGDVVIDQAKVDKQTKYFANREEFDDDEMFDLDDNHISSRYYGVTFTKLPKPDRKGYDAAVLAFEKMKTDTKRKLAILDPEAGLDVLTAFEAWQPTLETATAH